MIKISVDAVVVHLMVDDKVTLALKLSDGTYVDFPIYDESFPLVKAGKKFRLTLEEGEMKSDGPINTLPNLGKVSDVLMNPRNSSARIQEVDEGKKPYPNNEWLVENSKCDGKTPYHILDELRSDVAALGTIKKALNQLEVRNEERLASYPDPEIEAHRKHLQEAIMPEAKKVDELIAGTAGEVMPMSDEEVSEFIKTRSEYQEELAQEYQGSFDEVSKGPFCDGCKHIGVNPESGPCAVCFEGSRYDDSHKGVLPLENEVNPDEEFKYNARKRKCLQCSNIRKVPLCSECVDFGNFQSVFK